MKLLLLIAALLFAAYIITMAVTIAPTAQVQPAGGTTQLQPAEGTNYLQNAV